MSVQTVTAYTRGETMNYKYARLSMVFFQLYLPLIPERAYASLSRHRRSQGELQER